MSGFLHPSRSAVVLVLLLGGSSPSLAQLVVDHWTTESGLPQNSVNDILQTRDRYLWLATHGGLVRFDGLRFVVFDRSVPGIGNQRVMALHEDRAGTLWAASDNGMLIRYRDGQFQSFGPHGNAPQNGISRIEEDEDGGIWVTALGALTRFDGERFEVYTPSDFAGEISAPPATQYTETWWSEDPIGLRAFVRGRVRKYAIAPLLQQATITQVRHDRTGDVWISTAGHGVIRASEKGHARYTTREGLPTDGPRGLFTRAADSAVWFADADRPGVYRIRNGRREHVAIPKLMTAQPRSFFIDDEGSTWIGTTASGVFRMHDASIAVLDEIDGVSLRLAYAVLQTRDGSIWISTNGLQRYHDGRVTVYSSPKGLDPELVNCLYEDRAGRLWVGTNAGLRYVSGDHLVPYTDASGWLDGVVRALLQDRQGAFWFATDAGLVRASADGRTRYTTADGLSHDRITALFEDRSGVLWIGTALGVTRFDGQTFTTFTERDGLIGNHVRAFHEDADGHLWIGTYDGGLYRLVGQQLTRYTRADGLHDNGVFQILEDDDGFLWMGSNRGIQRVSRSELNDVAGGRRQILTVATFGHRDGLTSVEVNGGRPPAGLKTADGKLWFPTMGGVAVVDPSLFRVARRPPAAIVEEFHVDGKTVPLSPLVHVEASALTFDIRYSAPTFVRPEQVSFRYRLSGFNDDWVAAGTRREAGFYGIPPGRYTFEVAAADRGGEWSARAASLDIVILPPFWRTWWFLSLLLGGVMTLAVVAHHVRVRRLRGMHALQEGFSRQLIDSQENERRRISSEMHDSLGQELRIIKKLARSARQTSGAGSERDDTLDEIEAVAERLQAEMSEIAYNLRPHQLDNIGLSKTIESMIRRVERVADVRFVTDIAAIDDLLPAGARIHVFRIVQEAVSNVVEHSRASRATVVVRRDSTHIRIEVEDDGQGVQQKPLIAANALNGFGLMGIIERARILGGRAEIQSAASGGTLLAVTIPIDEASRD